MMSRWRILKNFQRMQVRLKENSNSTKTGSRRALWQSKLELNRTTNGQDMKIPSCLGISEQFGLSLAIKMAPLIPIKFDQWAGCRKMMRQRQFTRHLAVSQTGSRETSNKTVSNTQAQTDRISPSGPRMDHVLETGLLVAFRWSKLEHSSTADDGIMEFQVTQNRLTKVLWWR